MSSPAFVDTETTGITPEAGEIWEVGLIYPAGSGWIERRWFLPVNLRTADPIALGIGRFHDRHPHGNGYTEERWAGDVTDPADFAVEFARLTHGRHLVGAVISFDERRLWDLLRAEGVTPSWHYHIIDIEALAVGHILGVRQTICEFADPDADGPLDSEVANARGLPWDSKLLSEAVGVDPDEFTAHEALEDARWAKAVYEAVMG